MKKPNVKLISWTQDPLEVMAWSRRVMHAKVPDSIEEFKKDPEKYLGTNLEDYLKETLMQDGMPTFLEHINTVWILENVSRALQQQLTRHRVGFAFCIQSLRVSPQETFADDESFTYPENISEEKMYEYKRKMKDIQNIYNESLEEGINVQDARGLLPLNIHSTITFSANLRALFGMLNKRMCLKTQGEFREVANLMKEELCSKMDARLGKFIGPPCLIDGHCIMKAENEQQLKQNLLNGKQNTDHICPLYLKLFVNGDKNDA